MRWEATGLLLGLLAISGCATAGPDETVRDRQQWRRLQQRLHGEVMLAGAQAEATRPVEDGIFDPVEPCQAEALRKAARSARLAVVGIRVVDPAAPPPCADAASSQSKNTQVASARAGGTGIIIARDGLILTNDHVIRNAREISVVLHDNTIHQAALVARDRFRDLAVIRISAGDLTALSPHVIDPPARQTPVIALDGAGQGGDRARIGRMTRAAVSLQGQLDPSLQAYYGQLMETTAPIEPGFSGGPLLNARGDVVGISVAVASDRSDGASHSYAIPLSSRINDIIKTLASGRAVDHAYLGAYVKNVKPGCEARGVESAPAGVIIVEIHPDSPAADAGLRPGDVILALGGFPVQSADHLVRLTDASPIGEPLELRYQRNCQEHAVIVRLRPRPG